MQSYSGMFQELQRCFEIRVGGKERRNLLCLDQVIVSSCVRRSFYLGEGQAAEVAFPTCERTRSATAQGS